MKIKDINNIPQKLKKKENNYKIKIINLILIVT